MCAGILLFTVLPLSPDRKSGVAAAALIHRLQRQGHHECAQAMRVAPRPRGGQGGPSPFSIPQSTSEYSAFCSVFSQCYLCPFSFSQALLLSIPGPFHSHQPLRHTSAMPSLLGTLTPASVELHLSCHKCLGMGRGQQECPWRGLGPQEAGLPTAGLLWPGPPALALPGLGTFEEDENSESGDQWHPWLGAPLAWHRPGGPIFLD